MIPTLKSRPDTGHLTLNCYFDQTSFYVIRRTVISSNWLPFMLEWNAVGLFIDIMFSYYQLTKLYFIGKVFIQLFTKFLSYTSQMNILHL